MVINCLPNKTEVMCFGTAEKNRDLIPKEFNLGDKKIKLVSQTKVLGVILDQDLSFVEQSKDVHKKLLTRWNMICIYCNRNWGFTQKVMVQLTRSLFLSCLFYGSHIWMNNKNMKEINSLFYKILKTSVGAVFNIRQSISELILGLPPIHIQNRINQIKHYLKIIFNEVPEDRLKETIKENLSSSNPPVELLNAIKSVYQFLQWKVKLNSEIVSEVDKDIITSRDFTRFHMLSPDSCKYTKGLITKYTESLWYDSLQNEFLCDGLQVVPKPNCAPLNIDSKIPRKEEVMLMSLFYKNNLMNSFLHRLNRLATPSPLCHCGQEEQTVFHVVCRCEQVDHHLRSRAMVFLHGADVGEDTTEMLNLSRNKDFMDCLVKIISIQKDLLRDSIDLT